jgi:hypothetical protein
MFRDKRDSTGLGRIQLMQQQESETRSELALVLAVFPLAQL